MIELTHRKFREAKFFYACLVTERGRPPPNEPEAFLHYLSAFLSAGRSVTLALQREEKDKYDAWFNDWKRDKCTENERELMDHMVRQRNEALKRGEAETELSEEFIPVVDLRDDSHAHHPAYRLQWFEASARVLRRTYSFDLGDTKEDATQSCKRYLHSRTARQRLRFGPC